MPIAQVWCWETRLWTRGQNVSELSSSPLPSNSTRIRCQVAAVGGEGGQHARADMWEFQAVSRTCPGAAPAGKTA